MTVGVLLLYRLKLRMFFLGPLRRQPAMAVLFVLLALLFLPGAFGFGYFFGESPFARLPLLSMGALVVSLFAGAAFLMAPGGGFLLQPAEVDFVATAPVTVRRFALADALFQTTFYGASLLFVGVAALGYGLRTGAPVWAFLVPVVSFGLLIFSIVLLIQSLGIARLLGKRWAWPATGLAFTVFVLPALAEFGFRVRGAYTLVPYPTTAAVQVALLPFGMGQWIGVPVLAAYVLLALGVHTLATNRASLPNLRGTFAFTLTPEAKRTQQEALLRAFGRMRRIGGARLYRTRLVGTMSALHTVRMVRDGTLFLSLLMAVALGLPSLMTGGLAFGGMYVVLFIPIAATAQWMVSDRPNLWILSVSRAPAQAFFLGWWASLAALTAIVGASITVLASVVAGTLDGVAVVATIAGALGGAAGSMVGAARLPYAPNEFTVLPLLHMILTGGLAAVGFVPVLVLGIVLGSQPFVLGVAAVALAAAVAWFSWVLVDATTRKPVV